MTLTDRFLGLFTGQQARALTPNQIWGADVQDWWSGNASGERVDAKTAMTLSAVWSVVRLLSQDVATLPFHAIEKDGNARALVTPQPMWIDSPWPNDRNFTGVDYLSQVTISLLVDGNAFILALPDVVRPLELIVLNPLRVEVIRKDGEVTYNVRDDHNNIVRGNLNGFQMIHIPWIRNPGELRGMSPVEKQEQTIGRGLAAQEVSARFFGQGSLYGGLIEVPSEVDMSTDDVKSMLNALNSKHRGHRKAWALGALTGGAKWRDVQMKPADSQLLETEKWIKEQIGDAYGVPAFMQNTTEPGAVSYASSEQQGIRYKQSAIRPIVTRIEAAHNRLLPTGQEMKFNLDALLRAETEARWKAYTAAWQIGGMNMDEIRAREDLPPLPEGQGGDVHWVPLNYSPAEKVMALPLPPDLPARPGNEQGSTWRDSYQCLAERTIPPMAKTERRYAIDGWQTPEFDIRADGEGMTFDGYAAVFNSDSNPLPGWGTERIAPGAFTKTLTEKRNIRMFLNHNSDLLLASTRNGSLRLTEDDHGLKVEADLAPTTTGRDLAILAARGDVDSMSFGFQPAKYMPRDDGVDGTIHTEVRLWEVSPITSWPAYDATSAFVRHLAELTETAPEPLAEALELLVDPDGKLTVEQRDLLLAAVNVRTELPLVAPGVAALLERSARRMAEAGLL